ncbi:MAG TPA: glycosyltransferase family 4 protein [Solirubrobacteraceae bacterium]|jgi:glycosyltransferase involved in cell wall biosynthesis|nr:glycosyltransferase family 4 protein [Solirubrobacteraceae bacterium]
MVLFLHNRYRTIGGEERVVDELLALVREHLGESAELLERDSAALGKLSAARGLLRGGLAPGEVAKAVRLTGARVVHAHNLNPLFGWRALAAAREEGARVVAHLHQYRLVCATGVCFTGGRECTRCHARNTLPGVVRNCRGSRSEALAYGVSLALWQERLAEQADAFIVPSEFARERLRELGAPLDWERVHVLPPPVRTPPRVADAKSGSYALVVSRLAPEKGVDVAIEACRVAGVPLVVAGDGPERARLETQAGYSKAGSPSRLTGTPHAGGWTGVGDGEVGSEDAPIQVAKKGDAPPARAGHRDLRFLGHVDDAELERLRNGAALAIVPSRSAETFGMAAAEAMAAGVPVVASRIGALPELVERDGLVDPGDVTALAEAIGRRWRDVAAAERGRAQVRELCAPAAVAAGLAAVYGADGTN